MRRELEEVLELAGTLPADELPRLLGELEEVRARAFQRLSTPEQAPTSDALLTVKQVAARLSVSREYIYVHARQFPFFRPNKTGRALRFSAAGLDLYLKKSR